MQILVATSSFPPLVGGTAAYSFEICRGLARQHNDILLWTKSEVVDSGEVPPGFDVITVADSHFTTKWLRQHRSEQAWGEVMVQQRPEIVLVPRVDEFSIEVLHWAKRDGIPFTAIIHGHEKIEKDSVLQSAKRLFAVSNAVKELLPESLRAVTVVVPNGVDTVRFSPGKPDPAVLAKFDISGSSRGLLNVGSWVAHKGQSLLLEAMKSLLPPPEGPELWLVGSGPEERNLRRMADEYRIFDRIRWFDSVNDEELISLYRQAKFVILPSQGDQFGELEGFGLPVLEAAACGVTAIVSDRGGLPEAVVDGDTGVVVRGERATDFASAIELLWMQDEYRKKLEQAALVRAREEYTWEVVLQRLNRELKKFLRESSVQAASGDDHE